MQSSGTSYSRVAHRIGAVWASFEVSEAKVHSPVLHNRFIIVKQTGSPEHRKERVQIRNGSVSARLLICTLGLRG